MNSEASILDPRLVELRDAIAREARHGPTSAGAAAPLAHVHPRCPHARARMRSRTRPPAKAAHLRIGATQHLRQAWSETWFGLLLARRRAHPASLADVEIELFRVHAIEAAALLREAVILLCSDRGPIPARAARFHMGDAPSRVEWRRRARIEMDAWCADGFEAPALLRACVQHAFERWPTAVALAQAALALERSDVSTLCLACAELAEGARIDALARLRALLAGQPDEMLRAGVVRILAIVARDSDEAAPGVGGAP